MTFRRGDRVRPKNTTTIQYKFVAHLDTLPEYEGQNDCVFQSGNTMYFGVTAQLELIPEVFEAGKSYVRKDSPGEFIEVIAKIDNRILGWVRSYRDGSVIAGYSGVDDARKLYNEV